ncbi:hypothetical protein D3C73_902980 [compost metagenome]
MVEIPLSLSTTVTVVDACVGLVPPSTLNVIDGGVLSILFITKFTVELSFPAVSIPFAYIVKLFSIVTGAVYVFHVVPSKLYSFLLLSAE